MDEKRIPAERKSVRDDINSLGENGYGLDIELEGKRWKLLSRHFELAEIKLIVDCIASSKFLSEKKSKALIEKVESLVSIHQRRSLNRQVLVADRVKSMNEAGLDTLPLQCYIFCKQGSGIGPLLICFEKDRILL